MSSSEIANILRIIFIVLSIGLLVYILLPKKVKVGVEVSLQIVFLILTAIFGTIALISLIFLVWANKESILNNPVYVVMSTILGILFGIASILTKQ